MAYHRQPLHFINATKYWKSGKWKRNTERIHLLH